MRDGHSIVVTFAMDDAPGAVTCSDDSGGGHTYSVDVDVSINPNVRTVICSAHNVQNVSPGTQITVTHPNVTARAMSVAEFQGLARTSPVDQTNSGTGSSASPLSGSVTTTVAKELLIGAIGVEGPESETFTPGGGWTALPRRGTTGQSAASNITLHPEYRIVSATGGYQADGALSNSRNWAAAIATYKEDPVFMSVGATGVQNASLIIPGNNQYVGGAFTLARASNSTDVTGIILSETNTINANAHLSNVKIFYETAATCNYDGNETLFATSSSFDGSEKATLTSFVNPTVTYNAQFVEADIAFAITTDASNNIYVAGTQATSSGGDWAVRKYDAAGYLDTTWGNGGMVTYNSGGGQQDFAYAIAIDASSNIYVAGYQATNGIDWAVRKYDATGSLDTTWGMTGMVTYNSGGVQIDQATAITIDASNNIYVAGVQETNGSDWAVRKYDATGSLDTTWGVSGMVTYNSGGVLSDGASAITIDSSNSIYVAGYQETNFRDWAVRKYDGAGNLDITWGVSGMVTYNSGGMQEDYARAITIDSSNSIYVAGVQQTNGGDGSVRKYDATGSLDTAWGVSGMVTYNSGGAVADSANAITIDSSNSIYVAGSQLTNGSDWAVRKYDGAGNLDTTWGVSGIVTYNSGGTQADYARAIAIDASSNNLYVAGEQETGGVDWALRKYDLTGDLCEPMFVDTSQVCVYVVLDVGSGANNGDLLDIEITDPCTDVAVTSGYVSPCSAVAIPGASTTPVTLTSFDATGVEGGILIEWETASELDNLGFHLYRSISLEGAYERVTVQPIPGLGSSPVGAKYSYPDMRLENGVTYYYKLEDIETTGRTKLHGPVSATPRAWARAGGEDSGGGCLSGGSCSGEDGAGSLITYGDPKANSLRVMQRDRGGVVLELLTEGFYGEPQEDGSVSLEIPDFEVPREANEPAIPVKRAWVEAVAGRKVELLSVKAEGVEAFTNLRPTGAYTPELVAARDGTVRARLRRSSRLPARSGPSSRQGGLYPSEAARVVNVGFQGDVKKALVELSPFRWDGATGQLLLARRLVVRLSFRGREPAEEVTDGVSGRRRRTVRNRAGDVVVRLATKDRGLYAVSFEDVFGRRRRALPASKLRLSRQGEVVALHLEPRSDRFGPGSTLYFLTDGASANPYGDEAVYQLELADDGESMAEADAAPEGEIVPYYWHTESLERNRYYQAALVDAPDLWLWELVMAPSTKSFPFRVDALARRPEPSQLSLWLQGASDFPGFPDHHVRLYVNGALAEELSLEGKQARRIDAELPPGLVREGENVLSIENVGDTGAAYSMVMLDRFEVLYPRLSTAVDGRFEGKWSESGVAEISGLGTRALLLDTTNAHPRWLSGAEVGEGGSVRVRVESGRRYLAVSQEAVLRPELWKPRATGLRSENNGGDYLLIGPEEFLSVAAPLLELRRSEGLRVKAVSMEDIYSEFGFGEATPEALGEFLSYAYHEWRSPSPRYVVLLGDATFDFKDALKTGVKNWVPPRMVKTSYLWTASDPSYAAVNGEDILPDLAIGRLPAATIEEARSMVEKIVAYENGVAGLNAAPVVLVADNPDVAGNFVADADEIAAHLSERAVQRIYLNQLGVATTRASILRAFDDGASVVGYMGHGGIHLWASENVFNIGDVSSLTPQPQQPLLLLMNCLNGYFHFPYFNSLAEELLKAGDKGAIAAFASSGLSLNAKAHRYHRALVEELFSGRHGRLGDAVLAAQEAYAESGTFPELLSIYQLLGDPALRIH